MSLGICGACGAAQYPPREVCVRCLCDEIDVREREVAGTVVSLTTIHRPIHRKPGSGPATVASVRMDAGPVALAFAAPGVKIGTRVQLAVGAGESGGLLVALPFGAARP